MSSRHLARVVALVSALALLAALPGCGGDDEPVSGNEPVVGRLWVYGSWQTARLSGIVGDLFQQTHPGITKGSDMPGITEWEIFCGDTFDFVEGGGFMTTDHRIPSGDARYCKAVGIDWVELPVAVEAIAVITAENNPLNCLSFADFYALIGPESTGFGAWVDARALAEELGSTTDLPDAALGIYGPVRGPTIYNSLGDLFLADLADERGVKTRIRKDYQAESDIGKIVEGVRSTDFSLGWVDYTTAASAEGIKLLHMDGGHGCVPATVDTIAAGVYPLSRTIYLYVDKAKAAAQPHVSAFVDFYLSDHGLETAVGELEYLPLTQEAKAATRAIWAAR